MNGSSSSSSSGGSSSSGDDKKSLIDPNEFDSFEDFLKALDEGKEEEDTQPLNYQTKDLQIDAGNYFEVPIAVLQTKTKVKWFVSVKELEVVVSLRVRKQKKDSNQVEEEVIQEPTEVSADGGGLGDDSIRSTITSTTDLTETMGEMEKDPQTTTMGEFTILISEDETATILLQFDNTYSWFTPKNVSYMIEVIPPISETQIRRKESASQALKGIVKLFVHMETEYHDKIKAREKIDQELLEKVNLTKDYLLKVEESQKQLQDSNNELEINQKKSKQLQEEFTKQNDQLNRKQKDIVTLEKEIQKLQMELKNKQDEYRQMDDSLNDYKTKITEQNNSIKQMTSKVNEYYQMWQKTKKDMELKKEDAKQIEKLRQTIMEDEQKMNKNLIKLKRQVEALQQRC